MTTIKPCPFCGIEPKIQSQQICGEQPVRIACDSDSCGCNPGTSWVLTIKEAIADWNQRSGAKKRKKVT